MILTKILLLIAAATAVYALPSPLKGRQVGVITANYDDIPANPLLNTAMLSKPPTPYKGLCYTNVGVGNYSLNLAGFTPHSAPNALYNAPEETLGQPAKMSTNQCQAGGSFTASSIYVACTLPAGTGDLATVPTACTIQFTGTKRGGRTVSQKATYTPPGLLDGRTQKVNLIGFSQLVSLSIGTTGLSKATAVLFLDDFRYLKVPV